jgi:Domain of unknown function (DUF4157)
MLTPRIKAAQPTGDSQAAPERAPKPPPRMSWRPGNGVSNQAMQGLMRREPADHDTHAVDHGWGASPGAGPGAAWARARIPGYAPAGAYRVQRRTLAATADDPLEAAAEAMADRVMRMPAPHHVGRGLAASEAGGKDLARRAPASPVSPLVHMPGGDDGARSDPVAAEIRSTIGQGAPLPPATRGFMEGRIGMDLSGVRVHATGYADRLSDALHAQAFTVSRDIYFRSGQYQPDTSAGRHLLAHELTHVAQQAGTPGLIQRLIRTPYPWRGVIRPSMFFPWAAVRSAPNDSATILYRAQWGEFVTVQGASGDWLQVQSWSRGPVPAGYVRHTLVDDAASDAMERSVGTRMVWNPTGPGSGTTFEAWASAPTETPFPAVTATTDMNCWEAVMLAAHRAGSINWDWIHNLYTTVPFADWVAAMSRGPRQRYALSGFSLHRPQRGDLVFFDGLAHVALATGNGSDVYTFWPPPDTLLRPGTPDRVKVVTIEDLAAWWVTTTPTPPPPVVEFGAPSW